jgi:catechol 2,3-dioxygenase-like lactoylglutathione lyase family enzyme
VKRFHVHLHVADIETSVRFYSTLFGVAPTKHKPDYAKWMLTDPAVNFAISTERDHIGLSHLGFQVDGEEELAEVSAPAREASGDLLVERRVHCGYALGNKTWAKDPQGVRWETFHTYDNEMETFGCGAAEAWHEDRAGRKTELRPSRTTAPNSSPEK